MGPPLEQKYEAFKKLTASEQVGFAKRDPHGVCSIVWYLEGRIMSLDEAVYS